MASVSPAFGWARVVAKIETPALVVTFETIDVHGGIIASSEAATVRDYRTLSELLQPESVLTETLRESLGIPLKQAYHEYQQRESRGNSPLPVFAYTQPDGFWTESWSDYLQSVISFLPGLKAEVIGSVPVAGPPPVRARPRLPIVCVGIGTDAALALDAYEQKASYLRDPAVRKHGIRFETEKYVDWSGELPLPSAHVWVATQASFEMILVSEMLPPAEHLPDLVIVAGTDEVGMDRLRTLLERDVAIARLPETGDDTMSDAIGALLLRVIRDEPLHSAIRAAPKRIQKSYAFAGEFEDRSEDLKPSEPRLFATPRALDQLRVSAALPEIRRAAEANARIASFRAVDDLVRRLTDRYSSAITEQFAAILKRPDGVRRRHAELAAAPIEFKHEDRGLVRMCRLIEAGLSLRKENRQMEQDAVRLLSQRSELAEFLEEVHLRRLDATLRERNGDQTTPIGTSRVRSQSPLRLIAVIGQQLPDSLLANTPPALDPLLPPLPQEQPVELDFVLFPKDFVIESDARVSATLPRFGGTVAVQWDVIAPRIDPAAKHDQPALVEVGDGDGLVADSMAEMRLNVYCGNQLLQSLNITVVLDSGAPLGNSRFVAIDCDFTRTTRFTAVDTLPPRELSLAVNLDPAHHTHTLMIRGEGKKQAVRWSEAQMKSETDHARTALYTAIAGRGAGPKEQAGFDVHTLKVAHVADPEALNCSIRELADIGNRLFRNLFTQHAPLAKFEALLTRIRIESGLVIQVVRIDALYAFPWVLMYDYPIPAPVGSRAELPVCRGVSEDGRLCSCGATPAGYCLRGFWGVRHVIEQLCTITPPQNPKAPLQPARSMPVATVVPTMSDAYVESYVAQLGQVGAVTSRVHTPDGDLLPWLRLAQNRTNLFIFVSHVEEVMCGGELAARMVIKTGTSYVDLSALVAERQNGRWESERPLILLMSCAGAATRVDTGPSLAVGFIQLGAIGVLGAECSVYTSIAVRVAHDLQRKLGESDATGTRTKSIGLALQETIAQLAAEGCLGGLAFTFLGPADLRLPP